MNLRLFCLTCIVLPLCSRADIFQSIRANDITILQTADLTIRDKNGVTPLLYASALGSIESMQLLLEKGADPNAADNAGSTPLLWAACIPARVKLLLDKGANPNAKTKAGRTPLMAASSCESGLESVKQLIAKAPTSMPSPRTASPPSSKPLSPAGRYSRAHSSMRAPRPKSPTAAVSLPSWEPSAGTTLNSSAP